MSEFLQNINFQDLWVTLISFLSLNGATIVGLIIAWAKGKIKNGMQLEEIKAEAKAEKDALICSCNDTLKNVEKTIKDLELRISEALKAAEEAEKKEIEAQSIKLAEALNEAKSQALNLTEELDKL